MTQCAVLQLGSPSHNFADNPCPDVTELGHLAVHIGKAA
jgi:hypothetical protein